MKIEESFLALFKKCFYGTNLPSNTYLIQMIKDYMCADAEVIERTTEHALIRFNFERPIVIECVFKTGSNGAHTWVGEVKATTEIVKEEVVVKTC